MLLLWSWWGPKERAGVLGSASGDRWGNMNWQGTQESMAYFVCFVYFGNNDISIEKLVLVSGHHQKSSLGGFVNVYVGTKGSWLLPGTAITAFLCYCTSTVRNKHLCFADDKRTAYHVSNNPFPNIPKESILAFPMCVWHWCPFESMLVFFDSLLGFHNADVKAVCPWKGTSQTDVQVVWKNPGSSI